VRLRRMTSRGGSGGSGGGPGEDTVAPVNMTPLIDVVLCMIVFFLIVGRLAETQRSPMELPESISGRADMPQDSFVINIDPGGRDGDPGAGPIVMVDDEIVGYAAVTSLLRARLSREPNVVVQIRAPRDAPFGLVEPALDACAEAGVRDVRLATRRPDDEGGAR